MNRKELIHKWFSDNKLIYRIDPFDVEKVEEYIEELNHQIPLLYNLLKENDMVPKDSFSQFSNLINSEVKAAVTIGIVDAVLH